MPGPRIAGCRPTAVSAIMTTDRDGFSVYARGIQPKGRIRRPREIGVPVSIGASSCLRGYSCRDSDGLCVSAGGRSRPFGNRRAHKQKETAALAKNCEGSYTKKWIEETLTADIVKSSIIRWGAPRRTTCPAYASVATTLPRRALWRVEPLVRQDYKAVLVHALVQAARPQLKESGSAWRDGLRP
jgi:hypothetical protein